MPLTSTYIGTVTTNAPNPKLDFGVLEAGWYVLIAALANEAIDSLTPPGEPRITGAVVSSGFVGTYYRETQAFLAELTAGRSGTWDIERPGYSYRVFALYKLSEKPEVVDTSAFAITNVSYYQYTLTQDVQAGDLVIAASATRYNESSQNTDDVVTVDSLGWYGNSIYYKFLSGTADTDGTQAVYQDIANGNFNFISAIALSMRPAAKQVSFSGITLPSYIGSLNVSIPDRLDKKTLFAKGETSPFIAEGTYKHSKLVGKLSKNRAFN